MKQKILSVILAIVIANSTIFLNSTKRVDEQLDNANKITRKIFEKNLEDEDKKENKYVSSTYIKGVDGKEDYILSQCATGGYAIYDRESMTLIEYSDMIF